MTGLRLVVRSALSVLGACALLSTPAAAQDSYRVSLDPGTVVRFRLKAVPERDITGVVARTAGDTIVLRGEDAASNPRYPIAELARLEVRGGEDKRRGALIGIGIAAGITAVFGGNDLAHGSITRDDFVGTILGNAVIGALLGYIFAPTGWERIPLPATP